VREEFAAALLAAVRRAAATVEGYNVVIHTAPTGEDFHWHAEVLPRRDPLAGLELGAGVFVNAGP
jgi:galactose-1-phosphate uridylyltransferase